MVIGRRAWVVTAAVLVAAATPLVACRGSDEDAVKEQLARLARAFHTGEGSNPAFRAPRVRSEFEAVMAETVHVTASEVPTSLPSDRRALADMAVQLGTLYSSMDVEFRGVEVKMDDGHTMAQVAATAELSSGGPRGKHDTRAVNLIFYKVDGTWRVTSATIWPPDAR